jgi:hypothetical protein
VATRLRDPAVLVLIVALACSCTVLLALQSQLTFFGDDWNFLLERRGSSPAVFLDPHNDHIAIIPVAVYKAILSIFGMSSALPVQVVSTLVFLLSAVGLFVYLRRCVGGWLAVCGATLILFLGAAWIDLLWSFQIGLSGSIAAGLFALLALQRDDARGDQIACGLLVVSTAFSELGVSFALAALVNMALGPAPRRGRLYVVLVPLLLYAIWYVGWGHKGLHAFNLHNVLVSPKYVFEASSQAIASLLGLATPLTGEGSRPVGLIWGEILLLIGVVLAVRRVSRVGGISRGLATTLALGAAFWFLAAFNAYLDLRSPTSGRYQYPGAVFVLLIAAELVRGYRPTRRALIVTAAVTGTAVISGLFFLHDGYRIQKRESDLERARLAGLEIARPRVSPDTNVIVELFTQFQARSYFSAADAFGSLAWSEARLDSSGEIEREAADQLLASVLGIQLRPASPGSGTEGDRGCLPVQGSPNGDRSTPLQPGIYALTSPRESAGVHLARFADRPLVDLGVIQPGQAAALEIPSDRSTHPWRLAVVGSQPVMLCRPSSD